MAEKARTKIALRSVFNGYGYSDPLKSSENGWAVLGGAWASAMDGPLDCLDSSRVTTAPTVGSAGWILEERHNSNTLVTQELEDFTFSVRNELEWLNEHMFDMLASDKQHNLDVFKTPGKLRGKTPRTARKKAVDRQPLASIQSANAQHLTPAEQSLRSVKAKFQIAEDNQSENTTRQSPNKRTPIARQLFSKIGSAGKENVNNSFQAQVCDKRPAQPLATPWSPPRSTQDTAMSSQASDVFTPPQLQLTQPTQAADSFRHSSDDKEESRDNGDSFVSANDSFASKAASKASPRKDISVMDVDDEYKADQSQSDAQGTMLHHELSDREDEDMRDLSEFPDPPQRVVSDEYSISAETHDALDTANSRALAPEPKHLYLPEQSTTPAGPPPASPEAEVEHNGTVLHHDIDDQLSVDDDVRSPSDKSSPVRPLVRKSSLTFASLPAREPLLAKKSMGNRVSRTSHLDANKARNSHMGRFTGGKSLGGSQLAHPSELQHVEDTDTDTEHPELQKEESETTKAHNKTSTQRLFERINMLKQQNEAPKPISQNIASQQSQPQSYPSTQPREDAESVQASQPAYPSLPPPEPAQEEDDDDDWISPVRTVAHAPKPARPVLGKAHTTDVRPSPLKPSPTKLVSVSNPDLSAGAESTTPVGSPTTRKYMDAPISASKSKLYAAFKSAKEKLIGSSATSAQAKMDTLRERDSPERPKLLSQDSSDDNVFSSPKRPEKPASIFTHIRSPSKDSDKSSNKSATPSSPLKNDGRRTRSSTEREKQKERETREKDIRDAKQEQRADDKLRQMREKEQKKAAAQAQKLRAMGAKTPTAMSSQSSLRQPTTVATSKAPAQSAPQQPQPLFRPGVPRTNTASSREDADSAEDMPPPPAPKSLLPTTKTTKAPLREPRKLAKPSSKDGINKAKAPQKIMVNLKSSQYGQAPPPAPRPASQAAGKVAAASKQAPSGVSRPASALSANPWLSLQLPELVAPPTQVVEKPKAPVSQPTRADLGAARPVSRLQTVQDANRINIPPMNPAKPPKRQFPGEGDETLHRPAKRPSQQAKNMVPMTPAHAQFAKGKIPFAEPAHPPPSQAQHIQYPNGDDIKLPEIMTDSEDEDSENEFEQPSWVNTPNLREMLSNQQLMDPEHIFGPIAPLEMEKVFPNKERHKRFRERTSSAYWANDEVTAEEKRKEREARERLVRDGGWTYNPSPLPKQSGPSR
ncbi:inner centromere [Pyrenophora seminiperda CCB06]|uniref:Inner centromere n=1 Tax=Pyrenophora seminiperda CCB06 TaxID=1302712 RepID=A0A3M7MH28_9PLEO|nr:inner centromere [Pyrenophora seminiperda CCB06]